MGHSSVVNNLYAGCERLWEKKIFRKTSEYRLKPNIKTSRKILSLLMTVGPQSSSISSLIGVTVPIKQALPKLSCNAATQMSKCQTEKEGSDELEKSVFCKAGRSFEAQVTTVVVKSHQVNHIHPNSPNTFVCFETWN